MVVFLTPPQHTRDHVQRQRKDDGWVLLRRDGVQRLKMCFLSKLFRVPVTWRRLEPIVCSDIESIRDEKEKHNIPTQNYAKFSPVNIEVGELMKILRWSLKLLSKLPKLSFLLQQQLPFQRYIYGIFTSSFYLCPCFPRRLSFSCHCSLKLLRESCVFSAEIAHFFKDLLFSSYLHLHSLHFDSPGSGRLIKDCL